MRIKPRDKWSQTSRLSLKLSKGIIAFLKEIYSKTYAPNTRESIRKDVLHQFVQARIVDYNPENPELPVNSPNTHYAITSEAQEAIITFGTKAWKKGAESFKSEVGELTKRYIKERKQLLIPVKLSNGETLKLSQENTMLYKLQLFRILHQDLHMAVNCFIWAILPKRIYSLKMMF